MAKAAAQAEIEASADAVYALLADFGSIGWMPGITKVEVDGEGEGMSRSIHAGGNEPIVEMLESLDPARRRVAYTITRNNPLPVTDYRAHCTAVPLGEGRSRLEWVGTFTPDGVDEATALARVEAMYGLLVGWVKSALEGA